MRNFNKPFVIALDPSGNWSEGKGTTGWCVYNAADDKIIKADEISASAYNCAERYWDEHIRLLSRLIERYGNDNVAIVIEDYLLYANRATAQTNSRMETSQLLGILKYYCWTQAIPYTMQTASEVKKRWDNDILLYKKYIIRDGRNFRISGKASGLSRHCIDSIRHAIHYATFKNKEEP